MPRSPRPNLFSYSRCFRWLASLLFVLGAASAASAQPVGSAVPPGPWTLLDRMPPAEVLTEPYLRPVKSQALSLDVVWAGAIFAIAPQEDTPPAIANPLIITLPDPDGNWQRFRIVAYSCMEAPLAAAHPELTTYRGEGIDDPYASIRISLTPAGLMAHVRTVMANDKGGAWYIAPYTRGNAQLHTSFYRADEVKPDAPRDFTCETVDVDPALVGFAPRATVGPTRRQYRIAVATTGEFTTQVGGAAATLTRVTDAVNQLNGIYETEFGVRFVLIANESVLIYPTASGDPFTSPGSSSTTNNTLQSTLDTTIGTANYDIGHVFHYSTSNSGLAGGIGTVCVAATKGKGYSRYSSVFSTFFVSDYVAHEVGHQCGGRHPHNNCGGSGGDAAQYLVEPGSGSTIMGYAGICNTQNLQPNSDVYFNGLNINQIVTYLSGATGGACASTASTGNSAPTISSLVGYSIPAKTPFTLTASATDPNGDAITYCWEQQDGGTTVTYPPTTATDNGTCPLIRSRSATASPSRTVPPLANILANSINLQEMVPQVARAMDWRLTVRDNRSGGGGVNQATVVLAVQATGPFQITAPGAGTFSGPINVTWSLGGTNASPINCTNVKISLSTNGGNTFPTVLLASTPNTGSATVTLPDITSSTARIKVEAIGNIFFDISHANFSIVPNVPSVTFALASPPTVTDTFGNGNANARPDPGETHIDLLIPVLNSGSGTASGVNGNLTSDTPTATIVGGVSAYPSIGPSATATNIFAYTISVSPAHPCGTPISLTLALSSGQGSANLSVSLPTGVAIAPPAMTFAYTGPPVAIPDATSAGISINIPVSGVGTIGDLNFKFGGTSCDAGIGSTTVGLDHTYVGDLIVRLTSPAGTAVVLMSRPGSGNGTSSGSNGNNFCNTMLDDDVGTPLIQNIALDGTGAPYTGSYVPANPLSVFDGQSADGTWILNVSDNLSNDDGSVRAFSIIVTPAITYTCTPPGAATGACCLNDGSGACSLLSATSCAPIGAYQGDGSICSAGLCPLPTGACCLSGGSCTPMTSPACSTAGGAFQGAATTCTPNPCPQPTGACCTPAGTCNSLTSAACDASFGAYQGDNASCSPNPCPQPTGACCVPDGSCGSGTAAACAGTYQGNGSTCVPNPCPQPEGTCCLPTGACSVAVQTACSATWTSGALCTPTIPCAQPAGSCCAAVGVCTQSTQAACGGSWALGNPCTPNPCPQPTGACCSPSGACTQVTVAQCDSPGAYQGNATTCAPSLCPEQPRFVSVALAGSGSGAVSSTPSGLTCPEVCSAPFTWGTQITLTPIAAAHSVFVGWSGGVCAGTAPCVFTLTADASVTANFRCRADFNGLGGTSIVDVFDFVSAWFVSAPGSDFNGDGWITVTDIFAFLTAWFAGC